MRTPWLVLLTLALVAIAGPALAQAANPSNISVATHNDGRPDAQ